jgi:hypothetical protein
MKFDKNNHSSFSKNFHICSLCNSKEMGWMMNIALYRKIGLKSIKNLRLEYLNEKK